MDKKQIPVGELTLGMYVVELDRPWLGTPFLFQGFPITSEDQIDELKKHCRTVFVDSEREWRDDDSSERSAPGESLRGSVVYKEVTSVEKELPVAKQVYAACVESVNKSLESLRQAGELNPAPLMVAVSNMTRSIERNPDAMMLLFWLQQKGGSAFNRAVDTSIHMITFGRFLQFSAERLELLGLGGLLLDIGMLKLPDTILQKNDTLTGEEYELAKTHVMASIEMMRAAPGLRKGVEEIVLLHHERQDGSGYPQGLRNRQITIDGAIAGLVDSYTALISKRIYAEQESPSNALMVLLQAARQAFPRGAGRAIHPVPGHISRREHRRTQHRRSRDCNRAKPRAPAAAARDGDPRQVVASASHTNDSRPCERAQGDAGRTLSDQAHSAPRQAADRPLEILSLDGSPT